MRPKPLLGYRASSWPTLVYGIWRQWPAFAEGGKYAILSLDADWDYPLLVENHSLNERIIAKS